jgi:hypothetical protein
MMYERDGPELRAVKEARKTPSAPDGSHDRSVMTVYDLTAPASYLWPMMTPLRNRLPRVDVGPSSDRFVTMGEEDSGHVCGMPGSDSTDIEAMQCFRLLQKTMVKEENAILTGNRSLQLGRPDPAHLIVKHGAASIAAGRLVNVSVVALSLDGWVNSSAQAPGVATFKTVTGGDGKTYRMNGGSSDRSADSAIVLGSNDVLSAWVPPVHGAVAYAWFAGLIGHEALQCITTINSVVFDEPILTGKQPLSDIVEDCSMNEYAYDGLVTSALLSQRAYVDIRPTGDAGKGTPLTRSERGAIVEIDNMLAGMDERGLAVDTIFVNLQEMKQIYALFGTDEVAVYPGLGAEVTNGIAEGGDPAPLLSLHPQLPSGTIIGWASKYRDVGDSAGATTGAMWKDSAAVLTRQDYYSVDWPIVTRHQQTGVYVEEWLDVREPAAMAIITNIGAC